jgi:hypothetical protein
MSTLTGGDLNLVKPELTDDHKVTIGTDLPANFQKIDDEFSAHLDETASDAHVIDNITGLQSALDATVTKAFKKFTIPANTVGWIRIAQQTNVYQIFGGELSIVVMSSGSNNLGAGELSILSNQQTKKIVLKNSLVGTYGVTKLRLVDPNALWTAGNYIDLYAKVHSSAALDVYCRWIENAFISSPEQALTFLDTYILNPTVPEGYRTTEIELI